MGCCTVLFSTTKHHPDDTGHKGTSSSTFSRNPLSIYIDIYVYIHTHTPRIYGAESCLQFLLTGTPDATQPLHVGQASRAAGQVKQSR